MDFELIWELLIEVGVEVIRELKLMVAVELVLDDFGDTPCVLSANQLLRMQASFLAVVFLYIEESWRAVAPIVAQSIGLYYPSRLHKMNRNVFV